MKKCGGFGDCIYNTTAGCISPFNCPHKIEHESITTATSTPLNSNVIYTYETYKDKEIARLTAENEQLRARLKNAVELPCKVGDKVWFIFVAGKQSVIVESVIAQIKLTDRAIIVELGNSGRYLVFDYNGNLKENNYEIYLEYTKAKARLAEIKAKAKLKEIGGDDE